MSPRLYFRAMRAAEMKVHIALYRHRDLEVNFALKYGGRFDRDGNGEQAELTERWFALNRERSHRSRQAARFGHRVEKFLARTQPPAPTGEMV